MQAIVTDKRGVCLLRLLVCLSRGSTRLHRTKTAERIKIPFGVNTVGVPRNIVLEEDLDSSTARGGLSRNILPPVEPLYLKIG